jgi:tetratricopeptide (TPR) repeat protein
MTFAAKQYGSNSGLVGAMEFNLALTCLQAQRYQDAIIHYSRALGIYRKELGDRAPSVGYALFGAATAYSKLGDQATAKTLLATAIEILGPTLAAQRPEARWQ